MDPYVLPELKSAACKVIIKSFPTPPPKLAAANVTVSPTAYPVPGVVISTLVTVDVPAPLAVVIVIARLTPAPEVALCVTPVSVVAFLFVGLVVILDSKDPSLFNKSAPYTVLSYKYCPKPPTE